MIFADISSSSHSNQSQGNKVSENARNRDNDDGTLVVRRVSSELCRLSVDWFITLV
jgi:hypothetical protein